MQLDFVSTGNPTVPFWTQKVVDCSGALLDPAPRY